MKIQFFILSALIFIIGCRNIDDNKLTPNKKFLVDKIYDYDNQLIGDYIYDEENRLTQRIVVDPATGNRSDYLFEYEGDKVSNIIYIDEHFPQFNHNIRLYYDQEGKLLKDETYKYEQMVDTKSYLYNSDGKISSIVYADSSENYFVEYLDSDNAKKIKEIVLEPTTLTGPGPGTTKKIPRYKVFNYDSYKRPSFGIDYIFQIEILPKFGNEETFERNISKNNMTFYEGSGTTWIYTYNEHNLPITIETKWKDIETEHPILYRIKYKEIK